MNILKLKLFFAEIEGGAISIVCLRFCCICIARFRCIYLYECFWIYICIFCTISYLVKELCMYVSIWQSYPAAWLNFRLDGCRIKAKVSHSSCTDLQDDGPNMGRKSVTAAQILLEQQRDLLLFLLWASRVVPCVVLFSACQSTGAGPAATAAVAGLLLQPLPRLFHWFDGWLSKTAKFSVGNSGDGTDSVLPQIKLLQICLVWISLDKHG